MLAHETVLTIFVYHMHGCKFLQECGEGEELIDSCEKRTNSSMAIFFRIFPVFTQLLLVLPSSLFPSSKNDAFLKTHGHFE